MKRTKFYFTLLNLLLIISFANGQMLITGVMDGDMPGGTPKMIEFFVTTPIADLSEYGFGVAQNGGGSDGQEYTFNGSANPGDFIYFAHSANNGIANFQTFFGFSPDFSSGNGILSFNGNDAIELFWNGTLIDVFGDVTHGGNPSWNYANGWVQRDDFSNPSSGFSSGNWSINAGAVVGGTSNSDPGITPFPIGGYNHGPLPVTLTSFTSNLQGDDIILKWTTEQEINNAYFEIERKAQNESWRSIGRIDGHGTSTEAKKYTFLDTQPLYGENIYRLKQIDLDGTFTYSFLATTTIKKINVQVYPNPFSNTAKIHIQSPHEEQITLTLYDMMGNKITSWKQKNNQAPSEINVRSELAKGVYFLSVEFSRQQQLIKLVKH